MRCEGGHVYLSAAVRGRRDGFDVVLDLRWVLVSAVQIRRGPMEHQRSCDGGLLSYWVAMVGD